MYDCVIWDFNGTIADDIELGIECANVILKKRSLPLITDIEDYKNKFCFPIIEYYKKLGFDFSKEPYEVPADEWTELYIQNEIKIKPQKNIEKTLSEIKNKGIRQIILSSSEITMLKRELKQLGLYDYFEDIIGQDNTYAGGKIEAAKNYFKDKAMNSVLVGDTVHDYETALETGADCILFSGGHDSREKLIACGVPVIDDISKVLQYIN